MSSWAQRKQVTYASIIIIVFLLIIGIPIYFAFFRHAPSCFDGIQNQGEVGVDCGGPCSKLCPDEAQNPVTHWTRFFEISPGVYSVVADVENPNIGTFADNVPYSFKLYDENNVQIAEIDGSTFILPGTQFPIYEAGLLTGDRIPVRADFEFTATPDWQKKSYSLPGLAIINQSFSASSSPRLEADVQNQSDYTITNIELIALVYDENNNAIGASKTIIDSLAPKATGNAVFTWRDQFSSTSSKEVITPVVYPTFKQ